MCAINYLTLNNYPVMIGRNIKARLYLVVKTSPALSEFSGKIKTSFWDFSQVIRLAQH